MKGFSSMLTVFGGFAIAPYLVALTDHFINGSPAWFPYVVVLAVSLVLYAVGVDILRIFAAGIVVGVIMFGLGMKYYPQRIDFLQVDARAPF